MSKTRVLRFNSPEELADYAAAKLLDRLVAIQAERQIAELCLTGGRVANRMYSSFADQVAESALDPSALSLWWGDEQFVGLTHPDRHAGQSMAILARTMQLSASQTHTMPAQDGNSDPDEAAFSYARELGDTIFDVTLLGMGHEGHVAGIFPNHQSMDPTTATVIGVTDSPKPPSERVSLTIPALNRSRAVWFLVTGEEKAEAVRRAMSGDLELPAAHVRGMQETLWFLDSAAASELPRYNCSL